MSPQEHALSQSVLEFLIAKQDWFMLDIAPPPEGSPGTIWDPRVTGFEGKWKEVTQSREGSREGTPNVDTEAGPSVPRGAPKNPHPQSQAQAHVQAPLPRHAYNTQLQQSQMQPQSQPQPQPQPQSQPQSQQPRPIPQEQRHSKTSGYGSDVDDVMVIPNSDEEYDDDWISPMQGGGGSGFMALGGKGKGPFRGEKKTKSMRRRTIVDKSGEIFCLAFSILLSQLFLLELLPDPTSSDTAQSPPISTTVGVTRSRTLPSRKKGGGDDTLGTDSSGGGGKRERSAEKRVLKKQRGASGGGAATPANPTPTATTTTTTTNVVTRTSGG